MAQASNISFTICTTCAVGSRHSAPSLNVI